MANESEVRQGAVALVRGGEFRVMYEQSPGIWKLMKTRGKVPLTINLPVAEVISAIAEFNADSIVNECSRQESPFKTIARSRFYPKNAE